MSLPLLNDQNFYNDGFSHPIENDRVTVTAKMSNLLTSLDDIKDKKRSGKRRIIDEIYINLDGVSADDFVIERSILVKQLLLRYETVIERIHKPLEIAFMIVECIILGLRIYFTTENGSYIDKLKVVNSDIHHSCNEWILGFISEKMNAKETISDDEDNDDNDTGDSNNSNADVYMHTLNDDNCTQHSSLDLPHMSFFTPNDVEELENLSRKERHFECEKDVRMRQAMYDLNKLKRLNIIDDVESSADIFQRDNKVKHSPRVEKPNCGENVLTLIIDMKELELLIMYLLYVDRESLYGDIDITFNDKIGSSKTFCYLKDKRLTGKFNKYLYNSKENHLKDVYKNLTGLIENSVDSSDATVYGDNNAAAYDNKNNEYDDDVNNKTTYGVNRKVKIIEYLTLLQLDKLITSIIGAIFLDHVNDKNPYKFGLTDILRPKINKFIFKNENDFTTETRRRKLRGECPINTKRSRSHGVILSDNSVE